MQNDDVSTSRSLKVSASINKNDTSHWEPDDGFHFSITFVSAVLY